jgi:hypothetical protein
MAEDVGIWVREMAPGFELPATGGRKVSSMTNLTKEISSRGEFPEPEKLPAVVREIKT